MEKEKVLVCDICRNRIADKKCEFCGKDLCSVCGKKISLDIILNDSGDNKEIYFFNCCSNCSRDLRNDTFYSKDSNFTQLLNDVFVRSKHNLKLVITKRLILKKLQDGKGEEK